MKKIVSLISVLLIIIVLSVSVSAADYRQTIYLYRDFTPVTQNEDGVINFRYTADPSQIFSTASSIVNGVTSNNFVKVRGGTVSFEGLYGGNYWVNMYPLGTGLTDIDSGNPFDLLNVVSLQGFMAGAKLWIGYSLIGANIADDHHDIWIQYYDSRMTPTDNIQYQGTASTTDGRFFGIEVPIGVGSNPDNSYFSVIIQIDDIEPISDGDVTLTFNGVALSTSGTAEGSQLWSPIIPNRPNAGGLNDVNSADAAIGDIAKQLFSGFTGFTDDYTDAVIRFGSGFQMISVILTDFFQFEYIGYLLVFSVVWGVVALLYDLSPESRSAQSRAKSTRTQKGGAK